MVTVSVPAPSTVHAAAASGPAPPDPVAHWTGPEAAGRVIRIVVRSIAICQPCGTTFQ
jgi:hypothetical protein